MSTVVHWTDDGTLWYDIGLSHLGGMCYNGFVARQETRTHSMTRRHRSRSLPGSSPVPPQPQEGGDGDALGIWRLISAVTQTTRGWQVRRAGL